MTPDRLRQFLPWINSKPTNNQVRAGWFTASCPFAPWKHDKGTDAHPSFAISTNPTRKQVYTCFSCSSVGLLEHLPFELRDLYRNDKRPNYNFAKALEVLIADEDEELVFDVPDFEEPVKEFTEVSIWPEFYLESFKTVFAFPDALAYLKTRQITELQSQFLDLRFDTQRKRVCFPIRDYKGGLAGLHGRVIATEHPMKYFAYGYNNLRNPIVWLGESWVDFDKPVVIAESVFDLASAMRVYTNVISPLSVGLNKAKIERVDYAVQFISMFDHGAGGDGARALLDKHLTSPVHHIVPSSEYGDVGNMPVTAVAELLASYVS